MLFISLLACQETSETNVELDELRGQIYQLQLQLEELQSRNDELSSAHATLQDEVYNITSGVDIVGLYGTVQQNIQKISANTSSIQGLSTQQANLSADVSDNKADIINNTSLINSNYNSLDGRIQNLELYALTTTDLAGYATQGWIQGQNYASQTDVTNNSTLISSNASSISLNSSSLVALDGRVSLIENSFLCIPMLGSVTRICAASRC